MLIFAIINYNVMRDRKLSKILKEKAISLGLCQQWTDEWEDNSTPQGLIDKYIKGIDFAIKHDFPSTEFIEENFPAKLLHKNSIYVDDEIDVRGGETTVVLGKSHGDITYDGMDVGDVYIRHQSSIYVKVSGKAYVSISVFDDAEVFVFTDKTSKVFVYQYGGKVNKFDDNVIVRDRTDFKFDK